MKPLYILYGEEKFLLDNEIRGLKQKMKDATQEVFEELSADKLLEILTVPSLFAQKRLILLRDLDLGQDEEKLSKAFKSIPNGDVVVLLDPQGLDKRKKIYKSIAKIAEVIECKPFTDWQTDEVAEWVGKIAQKIKKKISFEDAELLVEICGRNLAGLYSEVEKIAVYAGNKPNIERPDIEAMATQAGMDAFGLTQALRRKQIKASFTALQNLLDNKEDPVPLLGLLASQYRMMFRIKILSKKGMGRQAMVKKLGASPYYVQKLSEVAANFSEEELKKDLYALLGCDLSLKSGGVAKVELPLLISELLNA